MELPPVEYLTGAVVGAAVFFEGVRRYFTGKKASPDDAPGLTFGLVERDQAERAVRALEAIATILKSISDQRQNHLLDTMEKIVDKLGSK